MTLPDKSLWNRIIAERCGWLHDEAGWFHPDKKLPGGRDRVSWMGTGDYIGSLDAMAQAEATLTEVQQVEFVLRLNEVVRRGRPVGDGIHQWFNVHATALQRAEAFISATNPTGENE